MNYRTVVEIEKKTLERWNFLLSKDLDNMTDTEKEKYNAKTYDKEGGFYAEFEDGSHITIDLESGGNNYYDEILWHSADGKVVPFDCNFEIGEESEVLETEGNTYIIEWKKVR